MSSFAEKRKFFLEVIDDMAKEEVETVRLLDQTLEEIANPGPGEPPVGDMRDTSPIPSPKRVKVV